MMVQTTKQESTTGVEVVRKDRESVGSLLRRFNQRIRQSGVLIAARQNRYRVNEPNRRRRRESALVRAEDRKKYRVLRKWGKVK
ncbi:MAG: hypothetical protein WD850_00250 [Candidatus Spechtbacterales bacterium]